MDTDLYADCPLAHSSFPEFEDSRFRFHGLLLTLIRIKVMEFKRIFNSHSFFSQTSNHISAVGS